MDNLYMVFLIDSSGLTNKFCLNYGSTEELSWKVEMTDTARREDNFLGYPRRLAVAGRDVSHSLLRSPDVHLVSISGI